MPEEVRFLREDIMSGVVTDIVLENWDYGETLNRPDALNASIPLTSDDGTDEILAPWRTAIYAVRGTRVEFGGILLPAPLPVGDAVVRINCFGWLGYWDRQRIRRDYTPNNVDQFNIFKHLVDDAQDEGFWGDGFDLGIDVTWDALSGVLRDRNDDYRPWMAKTVGDAIRALAALEDGFDFSMEYELNTTTDRIDKSIELHYPRKGRETGYLFEYERDANTNIIARGLADPVEFAWLGDGWGAGNDFTRLRSVYIDESLRGIYPPYEAAPTWSSVEEQSTLDEHTAAAFSRTNRPMPIPVVRVDPDSDPRWADHELGDTHNFRINDGYGSTGATPKRFRATSRKVDSVGNYDLVLGDPRGSADTTSEG